MTLSQPWQKAQAWIRLVEVKLLFRWHERGNRHGLCSYHWGAIGVVIVMGVMSTWIKYSGLWLFCEALLWRNVLEGTLLASEVFGLLVILETFFHNDWRSLTNSSNNFRVLNACQRDTEDTLSLVVEKTGRRTGGSRSANSWWWKDSSEKSMGIASL